MTSFSFSGLDQLWSEINVPLIKYLDNNIPSNLQQDTRDFLQICGLPTEVAPGLSFLTEITTINKLYKIDPIDDLEKYPLIGNDYGGNPLCIDTENGDNVVLLTCDTHFSEGEFINSSILQMSYCLYWYNSFFLSLASDDPECYDLRKFSNEEFESLKEKLTSIDSECLNEGAFWYSEMRMLLAERDEA